MDAWDFLPGVERILLESPLLRPIAEEALRARRVQTILAALGRRVGAVPPSIVADLEQVRGMARLDRLMDHALDCFSLQGFGDGLREEQSTPTSTPSKRQSKGLAE